MQLYAYSNNRAKTSNILLKKFFFYDVKIYSQVIISCISRLTSLIKKEFDEIEHNATVLRSCVVCRL